MLQTRRGFITALGATLFAAPAIVKATSLMSVKVIKPTIIDNWDLVANDWTKDAYDRFYNLGKYKGQGLQQTTGYWEERYDQVFAPYKGRPEYDAGLFYCPYVPLQTTRAKEPIIIEKRNKIYKENWKPQIEFKTRYGLCKEESPGVWNFSKV